MGPIELQGKINRLHIQRDDALRELAQLRASLTAARADVERLRNILVECGTNVDSRDTCGVCRLHFADCELDVYTHRECGPWNPEDMIQTCPGARARALLARTAPKGGDVSDCAHRYDSTGICTGCGLHEAYVMIGSPPPDPRDARIAELEAERDALREPVEPTTADDPSKDAIVMAHTLTAAVLGYNELAKRTDVLGEKVYWRLLRQKSADLLKENGGGSVEFALTQVILTLSHRPYRVEFTAQDIERMRETVAAYDAGYAKNEGKEGGRDD